MAVRSLAISSPREPAGQTCDVVQQLRVCSRSEPAGQYTSPAGGGLTQAKHDHFVSRVTLTLEAVELLHHSILSVTGRAFITAEMTIYQLELDVIALLAQQP